MSTRDYLIEIGTEELPPKALASLSKAFSGEILAGLKRLELGHGDAESFATPRRLALRVDSIKKRSLTNRSSASALRLKPASTVTATLPKRR